MSDLRFESSLVPVAQNGYLHVHTAEPGLVRGVVIFAAGFESPGYESRRIFLDIAKRISTSGFASVLFDYRGYGYSSGSFEDVRFLDQCADLMAVIQYSGKKWPNVPRSIWAASFGCAITAHVMATAEERCPVVFWGMSADIYTRYQKRYAAKLGPEGFGYTDKGSKITAAFLESLEGIDTSRDVGVSDYPLLLVHGDMDATAPVELSRAVSESRKDATLLEVPGGNHGFKAQPHQYEIAARSSIDWLMVMRG